MKTVVICAGGPEEELIPLAPFVKEGAVFIGADRGAVRLLESGIVPIAAVGDFDSVTDAEFSALAASGCPVDRRPAEKDETDTELALQKALTMDPVRVLITGVTGGRLDHMFSAIQLISRYASEKKGAELLLVNRQNEMRILHAGQTEIRHHASYPYLSFFPLTETVSGMTLRGVKYEVTGETMRLGDTRFTSNEIIGTSCTISILEGICLMVRSSDS